MSFTLSRNPAHIADEDRQPTHTLTAAAPPIATTTNA